MNRILITTAVIALSLSANAVPVLPAPTHPTSEHDTDRSYPDQSTVAAKSTFATTSTAAVAKSNPINAKDLAGTLKCIGKPGAFQGTVSSVYSPRDHDIVILDFDPNYRTALTAIVKPAAYPQFPPLKSLTGKHVLVTGKFIDYNGKAEIELINPSQICIIRTSQISTRH